ncbi:MAG: sulfotransferase [Pseudomonadota bacterium]
MEHMKLEDEKRYIFILTMGHSGGTLLNLLLGTSPAVFAAGESLRVWDLNNLNRQPFRTGDFWTSAVHQLSAHGWPIERLDQNSVERAPISFWQSWTDIVANITSNLVIADKTLSLKLIERICTANLVNPFFVHLVRDPRATCYSFCRKYSSDWRHALTWNRRHRAIERFINGRRNVVTVQYEALVKEPDKQLYYILNSAGAHFGIKLTEGLPKNIQDRDMNDQIFDNFIYVGNRMRFDENRRGKRISADNAYLSEFPARDWMTTTAICLRRLRKYGYAVTRSNAHNAEV